MTDETNLQRLRSGGRMAGAVFIGLFGLVFGLFLAGSSLYGAVAVFMRGPALLAAAIYLIVVLLLVSLGGFFAYQAVRVPITLWRDRRTPLPVIDGSPLVIARRHPRRVWQTLGFGAALGLMAILLAKNWPPTPGVSLLSYLPGGLVLLGFVVGLVRLWFPPRLFWEPIVLDGEGIEDRSLGRGKIPWSNVLDVSIGALAAGNGTLLKLTEPPQRTPGIGIFDIGLLPLLDRFVQGRRYLIIRAHGLNMHHERLFRLIHAHWRQGTRGPTGAITRSAR